MEFFVIGEIIYGLLHIDIFDYNLSIVVLGYKNF